MNRYILYWTNTELFYLTDNDSSPADFRMLMNHIGNRSNVIGVTDFYDNPPPFAVCTDSDNNA